MPHLITNTSERQTHPIYPNKRNGNSMTAKNKAGESPENKGTAIPKTHDAIKNAAGADMKGKK